MQIIKIILILVLIILLFILYKWMKPYFIKHNTTALFTGELGAGKTMEGVKLVQVLIRKQRFYKYYCYNFFKVKIANCIKRKRNIARLDKKKYKTYLITYKQAKKELKSMNKNTPSFYNDHLKDYLFKKDPIKLTTKRPKPMLYSNMPIHFRTHIFGKQKEWAEKLTPAHIMLLKKITEYSVVFIDEMPQFINQFEWDEDLVKQNVNEFITFFRHYVGGYLVLTAQSESDVVVQIRRKLNRAMWCYDFKKHLFGLFYTNRMCDIMLSDNVATMTSTDMDENTKLHFGLFPKKGTYDTRCYSIRYENIYEKASPRVFFDNVKTYFVLRVMDYTSPLDLKTTYAQKKQMWETCRRLGQIEESKQK